MNSALNKKNLHAVVEHLMASGGDAIAVEQATRQLSYRALNRLVNLAAAALRDAGVVPGDVVGLAMPASIECLIGILATIKRGAIFMALDLAAPEARQRQLFGMVNPRVLCLRPQDEATVRAMAERCPQGVSLLPLDVARLHGLPASAGDANPPILAGDDDTGYLIQTSGSTGVPKLIAGRNKGVSHFAHWEKTEFGLDSHTRASWLAAPTFDVCLREIFVPLLAGGTLVIPEPADRADSHALLDWLERSRITLLHCVPSLFRLLTRAARDLSRAPDSLRQVVLAGEPLYGADVANWREAAGGRAQLINFYGPSETTLAKLFHRIEEAYAPGAIVPLGRPIANAVVLILANGRLCEPGEVGELHIKTPFASNGYYRDPDTTAAAFIVNPLGDDPNDRIYKTGDLGRYRPDGSIEFVGRADRQVKIDGVRIELPEIELAMRQWPGIGEAVAHAFRLADGGNRLVVYFTLADPAVLPDGRTDCETAMREHLAQTLPTGMLPGHVVCLDDFPRNLNGKIDRRALPRPEALQTGDRGFVAPEGELETALAQLWAEALALDRVSVESQFLHIGGNSLRAIGLLGRINRQFGASLTLRDFFEDGTVRALARRLAASQPGPQQAAIERAPLASDYPLTEAQARLWVLTRIEGREALYLNPEWLELHGELDPLALRAAFQCLMDRHESLRTVFEAGEDGPRQRVLERAEVAWVEKDLGEGQIEPLAVAIERELAVGLEAGAPLWRVALLRDTPERHHLLVLMHHLICDGWSMALMNRELATAYRALCAGHTPSLGEAPLQMRDVAHWQASEARQTELSRHRDYWRGRLADLDRRAMLPTRSPESVRRDDGRAATAAIELGADTAAQLQAWLAARQATPFMGVAAALAVLLQRYGGSDTVVFGTPVEGRGHPQLADTVGFFVNTLPLALKVQPGLGLGELLERTRRAVAELHAHQDYPFERLAADYGDARDPLRNPLFEVMLAMEPAPGELALEPLAVLEHELDPGAARYDLTLRLAVGPQGWRLRLDYRRALFEPAFVARLGRHLANLLAALPTAADATVAALPMLDQAELEALRDWENGPSRPLPLGTIEAAFARQAALRPEAPALLGDAGEIDYRTLDQTANALAERLVLAQGVKPGQIVAVLLERTPQWPLALLATLKAGAVYLPLDPAFPDTRLLDLIADAGAGVVLTDATQEARLRRAGLPQQIATVVAGFDLPGRPVPPQTGGDPLAPAYLIYTSGSTGRPKAVQVSHRAFLNMIEDQIEALDMQPTDRVLQFVAPAFDVALFEIFLALGSGAALVLTDRARTATPQGFVEALRRYGVTVAAVTPGFLNSLIELPLLPLRLLNTGGESPRRADVARVLAQGIRYINAYGPSETAVCAAFHECLDAAGEGPLPLGRPTANTALRVVAPDLTPLPVGVPGELLIEGVGVGLGYLGQSALSATVFGLAADGTPRYRSGDRVVRRADGSLVFLGRLDGQVKVRGHRIEIGEVERALVSLPGVMDGRVLVRPVGDDTALVAYWTPTAEAAQVDEAAQRQQLIEALASRLPDYMVPRLLVRLTALPLNANGKLDVAALPEPRAALSHDRTEPVGPTETALARLWCEVLDLAQVGRHADFFALGGRSLAANRLVLRAARALQRAVTLADLYAAPTPASLAARLGGDSAPGAAPLAALSDTAPAPLSPMQQRLWVLHGIGQASAAYHIAGASEIEGPLDLPALRTAFADLAGRHAVLRSRIVVEGAEPLQRLDPPGAVAWHEFDGSALSQDERRARLLEFRDRPFDLAQQWPLRVLWCQEGPGRGSLLTVLHHIAADGWSMPLLAHDLALAYAARRAGRAPDWPALPSSYRELSVHWRESLARGDFAADADYWRRELAGPLPTLDLQTDFPRPAVQGLRGATLRLPLSPATRTALASLAERARCGEFAVALAALRLLLWRLAGQTDLVIGAPVAGRLHPDSERMVGCFVNTLPLRDRLVPEMPFADWLAWTAAKVAEGVQHQGYPFDRLVGELGLERDTARSPLFDVMLSVEPLGGPLQLDGVVCAERELPRSGSRCDLCWMFGLDGQGGRLDLEYDSDLFAPATVQALAERLFRLIEAAAATPAAALHRLDWLAPAERHWLLDTLNPASPALADSSVLERFEYWAQAMPEAPALIDDRESWSYGRLDAAAADWAARIQAALGVEAAAGRHIALQFERGPGWIVAVLAVLKVGSAYVPIEPDAPSARRRFLLEDSGAALLLYDRERERDDLPALPLLQLDEVGHGQPVQVARRGGEAPIYLMYTSGSTGRPKGVSTPQRAVLRLVSDSRYFEPVTGDRLLQLSNYAFDGATFDLFAALCHGLALCLPDRDTAMDPEALADFVERHGVTVSFVTTALFNQWVQAAPQSLRRLRKLYFGGQEANLPLVERALGLMQPGALVHVYGPTETTTFSTFHVVQPADLAGIHPRLPIGLPIGHTTAHVLDALGEPAPVGVPGELYIGGAGLALGYLGLPETTAERFVRVRSVDEPLYRSGDLTLRRDDGAIVFLGRLDGQVKIRGYRVELGEVEQALLTLPGVAQVHVMPRATAQGNLELVAYYTVASGAQVGEAVLRAHLAERLPGYMRPAHCVALAALPLNRNGKVDRAALPAPEPAAAPLAAVVAPSEGREQVLWQCWAEVLGRQDFGVEDNYFALGGDSIQAIQIAARLRERGFQLKVTQLLQSPTIAALAPQLAERTSGRAAVSVEWGQAPLLPIQHWFLEQDFSSAHHFNQSILLVLPAATTLATVQSALDRLIDRHDALRLRFGRDASGRPWQRFESAQPAALREVGCTELAQMQADIAATQASFRPAEAPLLQAVLYRLPEAARLFLTIHHWAVDGVSWRVLLDDLSRLLKDEQAELPPRTHSPAAWARRLAAEPRFVEQRAYWRERLGQPCGHLPQLRAEAVPAPVEARPLLAFVLDSTATGLLLGDGHTAYQTQGDELLLAAWLRTLAQIQYHPVCRIALEGHGREPLFDDLDLSRSVGWFTAMYPLCVQVDAEQWSLCVRQVKEALRGVPDRGLGYGVLRYLHGDAELAHGPVAETSFNYLGRFDDAMPLLLAPESTGDEIAPDTRLPHALDVTAEVKDGCLHVRMVADSGRYPLALFETLRRDFERNLHELAEHCRDCSAPQLSPSDIDFDGMDIAALDAFLDDLEQSVR
ncbi:amino acid adenylation domain-containing protein [Chitinimonas lacunae]|uniref:Amino acid adenylation domain-containing protein n=1 Tax=Chitinimonas lacunae TaxID=1963018 RepID=A0ABV8MPG6_9NEIS